MWSWFWKMSNKMKFGQSFENAQEWKKFKRNLKKKGKIKIIIIKISYKPKNFKTLSNNYFNLQT
jgi:plasmid maintenance system killer protein